MLNNNRISAREICYAIRDNKYFDLALNGISQNVIDSAVYVYDFSIDISPLHYAALYGRFDIVADLINKGANPKKVVNLQNLCSRLWFRDKPKLLKLLNYFFNDQGSIKGIDEIRTKIKATVNVSYSCGGTILIEAIKHGHQDLVKALIKAGANVNTKNYDNKTALDIAISQKKYAIAELLLYQEGIQVPNNNNILYEAIKNNVPLDIIQKLINRGASIEFKDNDRNTPLLLAAKEGRKDIIKLLITNNACTDATDNQNMNWEMAYRKKRMIPVYRALIVTLAAFTYAIIGAICTDNLFHNFKPSGWNISIIVASVVGVISLILTGRYSVGARDDCDVFIPEIKELIKQQALEQKILKGHTPPSAPPLGIPQEEQVVGPESYG